MEATTEKFLDMARAVGLKRKGMYTIKEVHLATGVPVATINLEIAEGRIGTFLPPGRERGRLIRPECVDEWLERGKRGVVAW